MNSSSVSVVLKTSILICGIVIHCATTESGSLFAQEETNDIVPRIPDGWTELPEWARKNLPFDASPYFAIPESENRERLYLEAFLAFDYGSGSLFYPGLDTSKEFEQNYNADRERTTQRYPVWDTVEYVNDIPQIAEANRQQALDLLKEYEPAFRKLEAAQTRPTCFFHREFDSDELGVATIARDVNRLIGWRCILELDQDHVFRNAEQSLRLTRDVQRLGDFLTFPMDADCFNWAVRPVLAFSNLSNKQLHGLLSALIEHYQERRKVDRYIEAARYEHLMFRNLLSQLQSGDYPKQTKTRQLQGFEGKLGPTLLIAELTDLMMAYAVKSSVLDEEIEALAITNPEMTKAADLLDQARKDREKKDEIEKHLSKGDIESVGAAPFLHHALLSMTDEDYENEVALLNTRYQQIEDACNKPYPASTADLKILDENWTLDESWRKTKLLKWFQPTWFLHSTRWKTDLRIGQYLCLAAAMHWQRTHDNLLPESLAQALQAVGIDDVPVDPYSGEPLKMAVVDKRIVIYSVGPDGDDDKAARRFNLFGNPPDKPENNPDGDVVLQIEYALQSERLVNSALKRKACETRLHRRR